jgi:AraC family transcriptional regulator, regulatory protein of adaptative response / methylated-DNA-[protein]-cysteine methyltransferase
MLHPLPDLNSLYNALLNKDESFEGIFTAEVKTTGIFCCPTCTTRKPKPENVEFFNSMMEALLHGYRPSKICHPLGYKCEIPLWLYPILIEVNSKPGIRLTDYDMRKKVIDPLRIRRWFKQHDGMTFKSYLRPLRIGIAFGRIQFNDKIIVVAC